MRTEELLAVGIFGRSSRLGERIEMLLKRGRDFSPRASVLHVAGSAMVLTALIVAGSLAPRRIAFAQARPAFEVVSVRPDTVARALMTTPRRSGNSITMTNTMLQFMVQYAYPGLLISEDLPRITYDIEARVEGDPSDDQIRLMFQSMLEDRFKLKVHRETREVPIYELIVAKNGPKLKPAQEDSNITVDGRPIRAGMICICLGEDGRHLMGKGVSMEQLANTLRGPLERPVKDRTGITGSVDFNVIYTPDDGPDSSSAPFLATAVQEQLGLRWESSKGPVEYVVIDHVEKPSEN